MGNANLNYSDASASSSAAAAAAANESSPGSSGFEKPTLGRQGSGKFKVRAGAVKSPRKKKLSKSMSARSMRNLDIQVGAALSKVQERLTKESTASGVESRVAFGSAQRLTRIILRFGRIREA